MNKILHMQNISNHLTEMHSVTPFSSVTTDVFTHDSINSGKWISFLYLLFLQSRCFLLGTQFRLNNVTIRCHTAYKISLINYLFYHWEPAKRLMCFSELVSMLHTVKFYIPQYISLFFQYNRQEKV